MSNKPNSKLIQGPVDELCGNPDDRNPGGGEYNGEPGYTKRTMGSNSLPEKTLDEQGEFGKAPSEG